MCSWYFHFQFCVSVDSVTSIVIIMLNRSHFFHVPSCGWDCDASRRDGGPWCLAVYDGSHWESHASDFSRYPRDGTGLRQGKHMGWGAGQKIRAWPDTEFCCVRCERIEPVQVQLATSDNKILKVVRLWFQPQVTRIFTGGKKHNFMCLFVDAFHVKVAWQYFSEFQLRTISCRKLIKYQAPHWLQNFA